MSGTVSSRPLVWLARYSPAGEPSIDEFLTTLRVLHHVRRDIHKRCCVVSLCNSITDVITYLELHSPREIHNIINLMYNS